MVAKEIYYCDYVVIRITEWFQKYASVVFGFGGKCGGMWLKDSWNGCFQCFQYFPNGSSRDTEEVFRVVARFKALCMYWQLIFAGKSIKTCFSYLIAFFIKHFQIFSFSDFSFFIFCFSTSTKKTINNNFSCFFLQTGKHFHRTSLLIKAFNHKFRLDLELNT